MKRATTHSLSAADLAEAKDLERRFTEAMSRKDLDAVMDCFWNSPDLIVVLFGNVQRGAEAVRGGIAQMFEQNESVKLTAALLMVTLAPDAGTESDSQLAAVSQLPVDPPVHAATGADAAEK